MKKTNSLYHGHRFPGAVISCAVRWYFHFQLSLRDIEELLFERGVVASHESIRRWCDKFGAGFAHRVKAARRALVQIAGGVEICSINKDTLFIEQDRIPDRGHSGILGPESTEVELTLANAVHELDA